jgi:hypothetical protein
MGLIMRHALLDTSPRRDEASALDPWLWYAPAAAPAKAAAPEPSEHFILSATRDALLLSTTALNRVSTFLHAFFLRMSFALAYARWIEATTEMARQFFPFAGPMAAFAASASKPFLDMPANRAQPAALQGLAASTAQIQDWACALNRRETAPLAALAVAFATAYADFSPHVSALFA